MTDTPLTRETTDLATQTDRLPNSDVVLLGTFGTESAPGALLRFRSGKVQRVALGDRVPGGRIVAIDDQHLILSRNGGTQRLTIPGS